MLATAVLLAAASFFLSRPAVGTAEGEPGGSTVVLTAKPFGRS